MGIEIRKRLSVWRHVGLYLCQAGIHRPLRFNQRAEDKQDNVLFFATCPCGKAWLSVKKSRWFGHKTERYQGGNNGGRKKAKSEQDDMFV